MWTSNYVYVSLQTLQCYLAETESYRMTDL